MYTFGHTIAREYNDNNNDIITNETFRNAILCRKSGKSSYVAALFRHVIQQKHNGRIRKNVPHIASASTHDGSYVPFEKINVDPST